MTRIIGITARKGVGKTTLAEMLNKIIEDSEIVAFADALKYDVQDMLNCMVANRAPSESDHGGPVTRTWLDKRKGSIFGPILQGYGEFARQWYGETFWIDAVDEYLKGFGDTVAIIPDVRHVNEAEWIKKQGGLLVSIYGPSRWEGDTRSDTHPSESNVELCQGYADISVPNSGDLDELEGWARIIAARIEGA